MRGLLYSGMMLLAALVLQAAFFPPLAVFGAHPDLVTLLVILFGLFWGPYSGALLGAVGGIGVDLLTGRLVGLGAVTRATVGWLAGRVGERFFSENYVVPVLAVLVGTVVEQSLFFVGARIFGVTGPAVGGFLLASAATGWYSALLAVPLVPGVLALTRRHPPVVEGAGRLSPEEWKGRG